MLYLDYAKQVGDRYILNFFADSVEDIDEVANGKEFITKNGKIYKLELVTTDDDKEVVESEKELNDWNDSSSDLDDIDLIDF